MKRIENISANVPIRKAPKVNACDEQLITDGLKKPLIAKWRAGVRLQSPTTLAQQQHQQQMTENVGPTTTTTTDGRLQQQHHHQHYHNHVNSHLPPPSPSLLEGIKRAQKSRLEDQRGTEINFELPEFLKNDTGAQSSDEQPPQPPQTVVMTERPKPAPRLSIGKSSSQQNASQQQHISSPTTNNSTVNSSNNNSLDSGILSNKSQLSNISSDVSLQSMTAEAVAGPAQQHQPQQQQYDNNVDEQEFSNNQKTLERGSGKVISMNAIAEDDDASRAAPPPPLPPKPKVVPREPSNWGNAKNIYLDHPTSSFV